MTTPSRKRVGVPKLNPATMNKDTRLPFGFPGAAGAGIGRMRKPTGEDWRALHPNPAPRPKRYANRRMGIGDT